MKRAKDLLVEAVETLLAARDDTAQLDAEVLMMYLQGYGRAQLYSRLDEPVDEETAARFKDLDRTPGPG